MYFSGLGTREARKILSNEIQKVNRLIFCFRMVECHVFCRLNDGTTLDHHLFSWIWICTFLGPRFTFEKAISFEDGI